MAITGLQNTDTLQFENDGTTANDARPKNYREGILISRPNGSTPLMALSSLMKTSSTNDPEYKWYEKTMSAMRIQIASDITNSVTTIPLSADKERSPARRWMCCRKSRPNII